MSKYNNYLKENKYHNNLLNKYVVAIYVIIHFGIIKPNKYHFIYFIDKIVLCDNTFKKIKLFCYFNWISIKSLNKKINPYTCITFIKKEDNIRFFQIVQIVSRNRTVSSYKSNS